MKCSEIEKHFSEYIDEQAAPEIAAAVEVHVAECEDCAARLESYRRFIRSFSMLEEEELPFDFHANFQERLQDELRRHPRRQPLTSRGWFKGLAVCACLLLCIGAFSLGVTVFGGGWIGRSGQDNTVADYDYAPSAEAPMVTMDRYMAGESKSYAGDDALIIAEEEGLDQAADGGSGVDAGNGAIANTMERKIIQNWSLSLEVTDFDAAFSTIEGVAARYGGYVVNAQKYDSTDAVSRNGWISLRVDAEQLNQALAEIEALGTVDNSNYYTSDVTAEYYDTQSRLEQYQAQEQRLVELYASANTIEDMVTIESKLVDVQMQIDSLEGTIRYYDQLTALSLIDVNIYTPSVYTQTVEPKGWEGFWKQIRDGFLSGLNALLDFFADLFVFIVRILPALVVLAVLALVIAVVIRRNRRRKHQPPQN